MQGDLQFSYETKRSAFKIPVFFFCFGLVLFFVGMLITGTLKVMAIFFGVLFSFIGLIMILIGALSIKRFTLILATNKLEKVNNKKGKNELILFSEISGHRVYESVGVVMLEIRVFEKGKEKKSIFMETLFDNPSSFDLFVLKFEEKINSFNSI